MAWILLDRYGKRFMNEYHPYLQDTGHRPLHYYEPTIQDYPRIPCYLITDETGRKLYPLGRPTSNDKDLRYDWSADNMAEIKSGILKRAGSIAELASQLGIDPTRRRGLDPTLERVRRRRHRRRIWPPAGLDARRQGTAILRCTRLAGRLEHPGRTRS